MQMHEAERPLLQGCQGLEAPFWPIFGTGSHYCYLCRYLTLSVCLSLASV